MNGFIRFVRAHQGIKHKCSFEVGFSEAWEDKKNHIEPKCRWALSFKRWQGRLLVWSTISKRFFLSSPCLKNPSPDLPHVRSMQIAGNQRVTDLCRVPLALPVPWRALTETAIFRRAWCRKMAGGASGTRSTGRIGAAQVVQFQMVCRRFACHTLPPERPAGHALIVQP